MESLCPFDKKVCSPECKLHNPEKKNCEIVLTLKGLSEIGEKFSKGSGGILGSLLGIGK